MSTLLEEQLEFIYNGLGVKRFHTEPVVHEQRIGQHSAGVAWLCLLMTAGSGEPDLRLQLIEAALTHDLAEYKTGDIPAPAKRHMGIRDLVGEYEDTFLHLHRLDYNLPDESQRILKLADAMDGMMYCVQERRLGNKNIERVYRNFHTYVAELKPANVEYSIFLFIAEQWRKAND